MRPNPSSQASATPSTTRARRTCERAHEPPPPCCERERARRSRVERTSTSIYNTVPVRQGAWCAVLLLLAVHTRLGRPPRAHAVAAWQAPNHAHPRAHVAAAADRAHEARPGGRPAVQLEEVVCRNIRTWREA